jgi:hypothetical protein
MDSDRWSAGLSADVKRWSDQVAGLAADALVDARIVGVEDFKRVVAIISEEVFVRLSLRDFPPVSEAELPRADA